MAVVYVARSAGLGRWASDVGLGKHVFKVGVAEEPLKPLLASGWAGETDWTLVAREEAGDLTEEEVLARLSRKEKMVDPAYYPRLKGATGIFRVSEAQVQNHLIVQRALAGEEDLAVAKPKPADFARYLIHNALR